MAMAMTLNVVYIRPSTLKGTTTTYVETTDAKLQNSAKSSY